MQLLRDCALVFSCLAALAVLPSAASGQTACHLLDSSTAIPAGFGAAYNLLSSDKEVLAEVHCGPGSEATLSVGSGQSSLHIYRTAYEWTGSDWRELALSGGTSAGNWFIGSAAANLVRSEAELTQDNFVVIWTCLPDGNRWKCGCRDTSCTENQWQLQAFKYEPTSEGGDTEVSGDFPAVRDCSGAKKLNASPSNFASVLSGAGACAVITLSPGQYPNTTMKNGRGITLRCSATAVVNQRGNGNGCKLKSLILESSDDVIVDSINFAGGELRIATSAKNILITNSYFGEPSGISGITTFPGRDIKNLQIIGNTIWNSKEQIFGGGNQGWSMDYGIKLAHKGDVLIDANQLIGKHNHSISLKRQVTYAEIINNRFINCGGICIEIGQEQSFIENGKIVAWTVGEAHIRSNLFENVVRNGIVARDVASVHIEDNVFKNAGNHAVMYWPLWRKAGVCNMGLCNSLNFLSTPNADPLITQIINNTFAGSNGMLFEGRGKKNDTVIFSGNTGSFSCRRIPMDSETASVHGNEETTDPPRVVGRPC